MGGICPAIINAEEDYSRTGFADSWIISLKEYVKNLHHDHRTISYKGKRKVRKSICAIMTEYDRKHSRNTFP
jgi:hypothetical protein